MGVHRNAAFGVEKGRPGQVAGRYRTGCIPASPACWSCHRSWWKLYDPTDSAPRRRRSPRHSCRAVRVSRSLPPIPHRTQVAFNTAVASTLAGSPGKQRSLVILRYAHDFDARPGRVAAGGVLPGKLSKCRSRVDLHHVRIGRVAGSLEVGGEHNRATAVETSPSGPSVAHSRSRGRPLSG